MEKKELVFTKLGTVKSDSFEYTIEDFFRLINANIRRDIDDNGVTFNSKDNCYEVLYNSVLYQIKDGKELFNKNNKKKELVDAFDDLIQLTKRQDKIINEEDNKNIINQNALSRYEQEELAIENGDKGIFNSNKDKRIYIKHLKNQIKENRNSLPMDILMHIIDLILVAVGPASAYGFVNLIEVSKPFFESDTPISILTAFLGILSPCLVLIGLAISVGGIYRLVCADKLPIIRLINNHKLKKMIKSLEKSTVKVNSKKKTDDNPVNNEKVEEVEKDNTDPIKQSVRKISREFEDLKNKILLVQDEETKVGYSSELLEIVNYYSDISATMEKKGNILSVHKNILNRIVSLSFRVDETLKKEQKDAQESSEFNRMLDEANKISAMGSRK